VLRPVVLASDEATQDPIDLAILRAADETGCASTGIRRIGAASASATDR
jgi:hypothetical protein